MSKSSDVGGYTVWMRWSDAGVRLQLTRKPKTPIDDNVLIGEYYSKDGTKFWFVTEDPAETFGKDIFGTLVVDKATLKILDTAFKKFEAKQ